MSSARLLVASASVYALSFVAGCASGPPMHAEVPAVHLVPEIAATDASLPVTLRAAPVQLGSTYGVGRDADNHLLPVTAQMDLVPTGPFRSVPWFSTTRPWLRGEEHDRIGSRASMFPSNEELSTNADENAPQTFIARTVPLLPYGAFWVEVVNHSDHAITVGPKELRLRDGTQTRRTLADRGAVDGRYDLVLRGVQAHGFGDLVANEGQTRARDALPMFDRSVTLAPGAVYSGYVVFDTRSYTADEYNQFLAHAGQVVVELTAASTTLAQVTFQGQNKSLPALCLPGTAHPSFARCELLDR